MLAAKESCYPAINFEETELRLGLPGGGDQDGKDNESLNSKSNGKRGFSETEAVDLKLHLSSPPTTATVKDVGVHRDEKEKEKAKPPAKAQVVGWPPVRSFRKNIAATQKASPNFDTNKAAATTIATTSAGSGVALVKVSMDGAPYLRKVDLKMYKGYKDLSHALATMFSPSKSIDPLNGSEYVPTYEDKDGDWMLIGDVPWEMFVESCKRLRIMKGSEAVGLGELKNGRAKAEA